MVDMSTAKIKQPASAYEELLTNARQRLSSIDPSLSCLTHSRQTRLADLFIIDLISEQSIPLYGPGWMRADDADLQALSELLSFETPSDSMTKFYVDQIQGGRERDLVSRLAGEDEMLAGDIMPA